MNKITLAGCVKNAPEFSHEILGEKFYKFEIEVLRKSGTSDVLPCIVSETMISDVAIMEGISLDGEVRTRNWMDDSGKSHMDVFVFVGEIYGYMGDDVNKVRLEGTICKEPYYRKTPLGREICDLLIASNRERGFGSDYIPSISWGRTAVRSSDMNIGDKVVTVGRLQSRIYVKKKDDKEIENRIAYELSISAIEELEE